MTQSGNQGEPVNYYTDQFLDALQYAADKHRHQPRKSTSTPYVSHLLTVAGIVMESGGNETLAIAALLHDAVEDVPVPVAEIRERFGDEIVEIVLACSDYVPEDDGGEKPPWIERKRKYLDRLAHEPKTALLVTVADKIHNGESILHDLHTHGPKVWKRFNASPADIAWYYASVLQIASKRLKNDYAIGRLRRLVEALSIAAVASTNPKPKKMKLRK